MTSVYRNIISRAVLILSVIFLGAGILFVTDSSALIGIKEGDAPKKIILDDIEGDSIDVSVLFGKKPVIIFFWELSTDKSFLNYSLDEIRFMNEFYEKYHEERDLEIISIYTPEEENSLPAEEKEALENLIKSNKIKFPVLLDRGFEAFRDYGVIALPSTIMVNKAGKINYIYPSFPLAAQPLLARKIDELVGIVAVEKEKEEVKTGEDSRSSRLYRYALQMYKKGLVEQALSPLKKSLEMDPDLAWSHNLMGIILWKRGLAEEAKAEFEKVFALDSDNVSARLNYAVLLIDQGHYEEAEDILETAPSHVKLKARAHHLLGILYRKTGRNERSMEEFNISYGLLMQENPSIKEKDILPFSLKISVLYHLAELHANKGDFKKAMELMQAAVRIAMGSEKKSDKVYKEEDLMVYE